jgi:hypothetical protein
MVKSDMSKSPGAAGYNRWTQPSYEIKVRGTIPTLRSPNYLWGSAGITKDITFDKPLLLHIHNDPFGEVITLGREKKASGTKETIGTLQPGEFISIPLNDISGVFASCEQESIVCCLIK